jgi:Putative mono-oxygenase ydhR
MWIYEDSQPAARGIYLFDTEEHARAWGDEAMPASLGRLPGVSDVEARYFDIDPRLSAIPRGPFFATHEVDWHRRPGKPPPTISTGTSRPTLAVTTPEVS